MTYMYHTGGEAASSASDGFEKLLGELQSGDCMVVERLECAAKDSGQLLALLDRLEAEGIRFRSIEEQFDTGTDAGRIALQLLRKFLQMDCREKQSDVPPKEDCRSKGRKPIEVDEELFDSILERWKNGEITARQAMAELELKPNTFYRRVKERMPDGKSTDSFLNAAKKFGKEIVNTVTEGSGELQQAAEKFAADHDMNTISDTVKKNITAAGKVLGHHIDSLSKDFQDAVEQFEKKKQDVPQAPVDSTPEKTVHEDSPVDQDIPMNDAPEDVRTEEASSQPEGIEYL